MTKVKGSMQRFEVDFGARVASFLDDCLMFLVFAAASVKTNKQTKTPTAVES